MGQVKEYAIIIQNIDRAIFHLNCAKFNCENLDLNKTRKEIEKCKQFLEGI